MASENGRTTTPVLRSVNNELPLSQDLQTPSGESVSLAQRVHGPRHAPHDLSDVTNVQRSPPSHPRNFPQPSDIADVRHSSQENDSDTATSQTSSTLTTPLSTATASPVSTSAGSLKRKRDENGIPVKDWKADGNDYRRASNGEPSPRRMRRTAATRGCR